MSDSRVVTFERTVDASAEVLFDLVADPARQPEWDGNENLAHAEPDQRILGIGDVFVMTLTREGMRRQNHVVEFVEGRVVAWKPSEEGLEPPGHLWRWEFEPLDDGRTLVRHTYDWTALFDEDRLPRARATTSQRLAASVDRLAEVAERRG